MVQLDKHDSDVIILLTPNRSLTWAEAKWIIAFMVAVVMIIAIAWTFIGAWVILPFAGIEVGLFAVLMYKVTRFTYSKQIVTFTTQDITIEMGIDRLQSTDSFPRFGTDIYYSETERDWRTPRITLQNGNKRVQIGQFLNADDMVILRNELEGLGFPVCREHWWKKRK
ncbi:DUF2244 domain-containing protein [Brumicola nitratireducens]|uniref:DUF2244 domain-containing protein n=1 Tax=Glaciecola nitratireducens (strain JCM 12485 / KCTC 12276 / FR1064) TaxID=1085623 RepID=G4QK76_GLANF|nr:DUF2244 domain-containing protein [Glaciecola nitratireducens]AEP29275.1 hypothetical protein GNIT_1148 [Glaciecola nitratireducens FR1064]